jgi:hypothetical protein
MAEASVLYFVLLLKINQDKYFLKIGDTMYYF